MEQCQKKTNTYALIVLQFAFCALYAGLYNRIFERGHAAGVHAGFNRRLLYIAVFSTTIGMSLQNIGQSMAPASHAVILLSLESVFGVLFSCLLLGEKVTLQMGVGFAIIFAALLSANLRRGKKIDARIRFGIINLKKPSLFFKARIFHLPSGRVYAILLIRAVRQMNRSPCRSRRGSLRGRAYWWHPSCRSRRGRAFLAPCMA